MAGEALFCRDKVIIKPTHRPYKRAKAHAAHRHPGVERLPPPPLPSHVSWTKWPLTLIPSLLHKTMRIKPTRNYTIDINNSVGH